MNGTAQNKIAIYLPKAWFKSGCGYDILKV